MREEDSHSKWVIRITGIIFLSTLTYLGKFEYERINQEIVNLKHQDELTAITITAVQQEAAVAKVQHEYMVISLNELKDGQKEVNRKLDTLVKR